MLKLIKKLFNLQIKQCITYYVYSNKFIRKASAKTFHSNVNQRTFSINTCQHSFHKQLLIHHNMPKCTNPIISAKSTYSQANKQNIINISAKLSAAPPRAHQPQNSKKLCNHSTSI